MHLIPSFAKYPLFCHIELCEVSQNNRASSLVLGQAQNNKV
ncbi:hypothetical protein [Campylobacter troglodytis]|nr:hypothetical protein [Campylobacter troglodytis]